MKLLVQIIKSNDLIVYGLVNPNEIIKTDTEVKIKISANKPDYVPFREKENLELEIEKLKKCLAISFHWLRQIKAGFDGMFGNQVLSYEEDAIKEAPEMVARAIRELEEAYPEDVLWKLFAQYQNGTGNNNGTK